MCEADVYMLRQGQEELLMEKVDRIVPGEDGNIFMENVFGERKVIRGRIREMELVHHRVVVEEIHEAPAGKSPELWLEPATDHGHFHAGEDVVIQLQSGHNMKPAEQASLEGIQAFVVSEAGVQQELHIHDHHGRKEINLGQEADGLLQIFARQAGEQTLFAKVLMEIGHHHHHSVEPIGLPLEIVPVKYSHARMGESFEIQVLKDGQALAGIEVRATYGGTKNPDYPHRMTTDAEGKACIFLTARGNYLFTVEDSSVTSTYTLVKGF